jgi:hypothetical protein
VGECFNGAANMSGVHKGLATRMKECSPLVVYVHCYSHLLNLALQDSMTSIESARNALGMVQKLYTFLEASPKRHRIFQDLEIEEDHINLTLKSLSATRWLCRWEAVRAVVEQITRIVQALISCSDPTTYTDSNALLNSICDFNFVFVIAKGCLVKYRQSVRVPSEQYGCYHSQENRRINYQNSRRLPK